MNEFPRHFILGTAGHVDHGKSTLVRILTGTNPDRLPEEKARGMTIDLGFAELRLQSSKDHSTLSIGVIDVPGHEDFIRNMVAGVSALDAALLVVAADDGWMPQTEEHLQILTYLGVRRLIVALTKIDLASDESAAVAATRRCLGDTPFANAPIVPTSVVTRRGLEELKSTIALVLSDLPPPRDLRKPRLAVDRAFTLKGIGTIVTGTLIGGRLSRGDQVVVQPGGAGAHIRSMQNHGSEISLAIPSSRIAMNLPEIRPGDAKESVSARIVRRGDVITAGATHPSRHLCVMLLRSPRATPTGTVMAAARAIKNGELALLHHGCGAIRARVRLIEGNDADQNCVAMLKIEKPVLTFAGDRFVLRDESQRQTLAGGVVLDPFAPLVYVRNLAYRSALMNLAKKPDDANAQLRVELVRDPVLQRSSVLAQTNFDPEEVDAAISNALASDTAIAAGPLIVANTLRRSLCQMVKARVDAFHQHSSQQNGMPVAEVCATVAQGVRQKARRDVTTILIDLLIADMCRDGFVYADGLLWRASHSPSLPPRLQPIGDGLLRRLVENPFNPPSRGELCTTDISQQALRFLIASGKAVTLSPEVVISSEAYGNAISAIRAYLSVHGAATVSELKVLLSSNRRVVVPLLEKADKDGITRRDGNLRRLRS